MIRHAVDEYHLYWSWIWTNTYVVEEYRLSSIVNVGPLWLAYLVFTRRIFLAGWCAMYCLLPFHLRLLTCMCLVRWLLWQWTDLPMDWGAYVVRQSFVSFLVLSLQLVMIEDGYFCCSAALNLVGIWLIVGWHLLWLLLSCRVLIFLFVLLLLHRIVLSLVMSRSSRQVVRLLIRRLGRRVSGLLLCLFEFVAPIQLLAILQSIWTHSQLVLRIILVLIRLVWVHWPFLLVRWLLDVRQTHSLY